MKLILFGDIPNWNRSIQLLQTYRPDIFIAGLSSVSLGQFASSSVTSIRQRKPQPSTVHTRLTASLTFKGKIPTISAC